MPKSGISGAQGIRYCKANISTFEVGDGGTEICAPISICLTACWSCLLVFFVLKNCRHRSRDSGGRYSRRHEAPTEEVRW